LSKVNEKQKKELEDCMKRMEEIEAKKLEKEARHQLQLQELQKSLEEKNMSWAEKKKRIQEETEERYLKKKEDLERSIQQTDKMLVIFLLVSSLSERERARGSKGDEGPQGGEPAQEGNPQGQQEAGR